MWRAFFLALGVTLILLGIECFLIDQVEITHFRRAPEPQSLNNQLFAPPSAQPASFVTPVKREGSFWYQPKDWVPWSLLAVGTVVLIYTCTLPGRTKSGDGD